MKSNISTPCRKCGSTEKYKNGHCRPCSLEYAREYRNVHRDERLDHQRRWYAANSEVARQTSRRWYHANKERMAERAHRYYAENRDKIAAKNREWRSKNAQAIKTKQKCYYDGNVEIARQRTREWKRENAEKVRIMNQQRRARVKNAKGDFTFEEWVQLKQRYGNRCLCCGRSDVKLTPDHVVPLSKGGSNYINNIQPLCRSCNCSKKDREIDYR